MDFATQGIFLFSESDFGRPKQILHALSKFQYYVNYFDRIFLFSYNARISRTPNLNNRLLILRRNFARSCLVKIKKFPNQVSDGAFADVKQMICKEAILAFPNFNEEFVIYTDASNYQLGGVITQKKRPLAFYSRKLKDAQTRYTTTERELLSIVEILKEFRTILLGHKVIVYTDHKNLIYNDLQTDQVLRWRLLLEEFGVEIRYIKGVKNIVTDVLSRYPTTNDSTVPQLPPITKQVSELFAGEDIFPPIVHDCGLSAMRFRTNENSRCRQ